jgi:hypothetical protein
MTRLPPTQLLAIQPTQGHLCKVCGSCHRTATPSLHPASCRHAMRSRRVSYASMLPDTPGSRLRRVGPSDLVLRAKPRNRPPMVLWANHQTPRARPGLPPSLLTLPPPCTGSIIHDFFLLVSPPCGPHLVPPSTGSLEPSLHVSPSPRGPSRLKTFRAPQAEKNERKENQRRCCIRQDKGREATCEDQKMTKPTKPEDKPAPKMVRKWVPKIATPAKSVDPE